MLSKSKLLFPVLLMVMLAIACCPLAKHDCAYAANSTPGKISTIKVKTSGKTATIKWSKSKKAKKYQVVVKLGKKKVASKKIKGRTLKLKKLKANKKYIVQVRGINGSFKGKWKKKVFRTKKASSTKTKSDDSSSKPDSSDQGNHNTDGDDNWDDDDDDWDDDWDDDDSRINIGQIENLIENGEIEATYNDFGGVGFINGGISDSIITDEESAKDVLYEYERLIGGGFSAADSEVTLTEENFGSDSPSQSSLYRFSPTYDGIPVYGSQVILEAGADGKVQGFYNTYDTRISSVDTYSEIDSEDAELIAARDFVDRFPFSLDLSLDDDDDEDYSIVDQLSDKMGFDIDSEEIIFAADEDIMPFLAYRVTISSEAALENDDADEEAITDEIEVDSYDDSDEVNEASQDDELSYNFEYQYHILANDSSTVGDVGDIYLVDDGFRDWASVSCSSKDGTGKTRKYNALKSGSFIKLVDKARNIKTYKAMWSGTGVGDRLLLPGTIVLGITIPEAAVSVHANLAAVYDFYQSIGRDSFDGHGAEIIGTYNFANGGTFNNASWGMGQIVFGNVSHFERALDVVGHEFTHGVVSYTSKFGGSAAADALNEAYGDIMGLLIEGKSGNDKWIIGEDSTYGSVRNISQKHTYSEFDRDADCHDNCRIMDYTAYLMMTDSRCSGISNKTWAKLFLGSLNRLSSSSNFMNVRDALVGTAGRLSFTSPQIQAIKEAFAENGILKDSIRISMRWTSEPSDLDLHVVGPSPDGSRFHVYYSDLKTYNSFGRLMADLDHDDTNYEGPEVTTIRTLVPGDYYVFVHDYTNRDTLGSTVLLTSGVMVNIYQGEEGMPSKTYYISNLTDRIKGTYWNVCKISVSADGSYEITEINTLRDEQEYN